MIELEQKSPEIATYERARNVKIGKAVIDASEIGINDPIAHLYKFIKKGDESLDSIKEVATDIAERLPNVPFVNYVGFELRGNDFISEKDKVSMVEMTGNNMRILKLESMYDSSLMPEYERAKLEVEEVAKLAGWYESAKIGSCFVFESLPMGKQKVAVTRIYQKTADGRLNGCFLSLHNPNVDRFNGLRQKIGVIGHSDLHTELDILKNGYQFHHERLMNLEDFVDFYVDAYDELLLEQSGKIHRFGIETSDTPRIENGIEKVKSRPDLISNYVEMLTVMRNSEGVVSPDLFRMCKRFGIGENLSIGENMKTSTYRVLLKGLIKYMTRTIDGVDASSNYSGEAGVSNRSYDSLACPEIDITLRSNSGESGATYNRMTRFEQRALLWAYGIYEDLVDFGVPRIDNCKTKNCPSHRETKPCVVGGCGFCKECHKILGREEDSNPERVYKKEEEKTKRLEAEKLEAELIDKKAKEESEMVEKTKAINAEEEFIRAKQERERKVARYQQTAVDLAWLKKAA